MSMKSNNKRSFKRIVSAILILTILVLCVSGMPYNRKEAKAEEYGLSNPTWNGNVSTWDCVWFGKYWQEDTNGDGVADENDEKTPIKWRVLSVNGDDVFLMADRCLNRKKYNEVSAGLTWNNCTLRSWLNCYDSSYNTANIDYSADGFLSSAFSTEERDSVQKGYLGDYVYLASSSEVTNETYGFLADLGTASETRIAKNTDFTNSKDESFQSCFWWVREPVVTTRAWVMRITPDGYGNEMCYSPISDVMMVRPVLHLDLSSNVWKYAGTVSSDGTVNEVETSNFNSESRKNKTFNEYIYRSDVLMDDSVPSSKVWRSVIKEPGICEELVDELGNGMRVASDLWTMIHDIGDSIDNPASEVDIILREQDTYQAIIFDVLSQFSFSECFGKTGEAVSTVNGKIKTTNKLIKHLNEQYKNTGKLGWINEITKHSEKKWSDLSVSEQEEGWEAINDFYKLGNPEWVSKLSKGLKNAGILSKLGGTIYDTIEYIGNIYSLYQMTDAMKDVLYIMFQKCPESNVALKNALKDNYEIISSNMENFIDKASMGAVSVLGRYTLNIWMGIFWEELKESLVASNPYVLTIWVAYQGSTFLCNSLFNTDKTVEAYYNMLSMKDFKDIVQKSYETIKEQYIASQTAQNAELFLAVNQIMNNSIYNDWGYGIKYYSALDSAIISKIGEITKKNKTEELINAMKSIQNSYKLGYASTLTSWIYCLEEDFPNEYSNYCDILNEDFDVDEFVKSYKIACPVDVLIYNMNNKLVASVINDIPYNETDDLIIYVNGDNKTILFSKDSDQYHLEYVGNNIGTMDVQIQEFQNGDSIRTVGFNQLPLEDNIKYESEYTNNILDDVTYYITKDKDVSEANYDSSNDKIVKHHIRIENGALKHNNEIGTEFDLQEGEKVELIPLIAKDMKNVKWQVSGDVEVITEDDISYIFVGKKDITVTGMLVESYTINALSTSGGKITPFGEKIVGEESDQIYYIKADKGYSISDVLVDGVSVGKTEYYIFENVKQNHYIKAIFVENMEPDPSTSASPTASVSPTASPVASATTSPAASATASPTASPAVSASPTTSPATRATASPAVSASPTASSVTSTTACPAVSASPTTSSVAGATTSPTASASPVASAAIEKQAVSEIKIVKVTCNSKTKKVVVKLKIKGANVKIKVGKKSYKKAKAKGKTYTLKLGYRLKEKQKVIILITKKNYKTLKNTYLVKSKQKKKKPIF